MADPQITLADIKTATKFNQLVRGGLGDEDLENLRLILARHRTEALARAGWGEARTDGGLERFIFQWFNERDPDEMQRCLSQYKERCTAPPIRALVPGEKNERNGK